MTIPAGAIYCTSCQEACHDHPSICTVCGTPLTNFPEATTQQQRAASQYSLVPEDLVQDIRQNARHLSDLLQHVQRSVLDTQNAQQELMESLEILRGEIQQTPLTATSPNLRATAGSTLEQLPRIVLENTLFLHPSTIELRNEERVLLRFEAIPGEFGAAQPCCIEDAALIVAEPKTAKGTVISAGTKNAVQEKPSILYMERGDGVSFARKALLAQQAGAQAVIIGNHLAEPWPYVMRDSTKEAEREHLMIPVVMIKQADARALLHACSQSSSPVLCQFKIQKQAKECVICTEDFHLSQTVLRLPECGHIFHESCALMWLKAHNTCPSCRRELPTDDQTYEQERRRTQRTHAGSEGVSSSQGRLNEMYR